jgi:zinc protease
MSEIWGKAARAIWVSLCVALAGLPAMAETVIQEVTSPGGIKAWLVEEHGIPFTALAISFQGGTSLDAPGARGATNLMVGVIEEGAGQRDAQGFAAARDGLAADFSFGASIDTLSVRARFLSANRDEAMELLRQALIEPRFDADALERVRGQVLANLRSEAKDPGALAGEALRERMFGGHVYGLPTDGTVDSVTALTRADIVAAHQGALARDRMTVSATGDITAAELGALLDRLLGGLPVTGTALPGRAEIEGTGGMMVTDFPGPQAILSFAAPGIRFDDPEYFAAVVMNEILGGERFGSRLMEELREKRGLTYGVRSSLSVYDQAELISGSFATGVETAGEALEVLRAEWARMATGGVSAEELEAAKRYLTGSYPLRFDGNAAIASILVGMQTLGLSPDYPKTRNDLVEAVSAQDVARVAARLLDPAKLFVVVVGEGTGIAASE